MTGGISFNTNNLQTFNGFVGIITDTITHMDLPQKVMTLYELAEADRSAIPSINYPSRTISISGTIVGDTKSNLDSRIDTFNGYLNGKAKHLDVEFAGSTRRYFATVNAKTISISKNGLYARFNIEFICTDPFGYDVTATNIANVTGRTTASYTVTPTIQGSAPYQLPIATITINNLTGTGDYIQISNNENNQSIMVSSVGFANGDVLVINSATREVKLNNSPVDYLGTFLELEPGASSITVVDGFTTRNINILIEYYKRYM